MTVKLRLILKVILCFLFIITVWSCKKEITEAFPAKTNKNLKYFGFTLIDVGWDDPTDQSTQTNYLDEVKGFTNLADILVVEPSDNIVGRIEKMAEANVQSVLHLNELFFENTGAGGTTSGFIYTLRQDFKERWDEFMDINQLSSHVSLIGVLYLGEEPAWNGITEDDFTKAANYVKQTIPEVPILLVEAFAIVNEMYVPDAVDWVGFDHYFLKEPTTNQSFQEELSVMKAKMQPTQKICLILDSHWIKIAHGSSGISKFDMDVIARDYFKMANADTSIVALLGYYWPNGFEFKNAIGGRGMPENVKAEYEKIGKAITGK